MMIRTATRMTTATAKMTDMERDAMAALAMASLLAIEVEDSTLRVSQLILTSMEVLEVELDVEYSNIW